MSCRHQMYIPNTSCSHFTSMSCSLRRSCTSTSLCCRFSSASATPPVLQATKPNSTFACCPPHVTARSLRPLGASERASQLCPSFPFPWVRPRNQHQSLQVTGEPMPSPPLSFSALPYSHYGRLSGSRTRSFSSCGLKL